MCYFMLINFAEVQDAVGVQGQFHKHLVTYGLGTDHEFCI